MLEKEGLSCNLGELAWRTFPMHVINCSVCGTKQHANFPIKQEKQNLPVCRPVPMMTVTALSTLTHTVEGYTEEIQKNKCARYRRSKNFALTWWNTKHNYHQRGPSLSSITNFDSNARAGNNLTKKDWSINDELAWRTFLMHVISS